MGLDLTCLRAVANFASLIREVDRHATRTDHPVLRAALLFRRRPRIRPGYGRRDLGRHAAGGGIPRGFVPEYPDIFTATVRWYTPSGPGAYDPDSTSIQIPVFGGNVPWNVVPDPAFQRTASNSGQVMLNLTNRSPNTVWLKSTNPWEIRDDAGGPVYSPATSPACTPVPPAQTKSYAWALVRPDSSCVEPGAWSATSTSSTAPGT